jgi:hypothetical protein
MFLKKCYFIWNIIYEYCPLSVAEIVLQLGIKLHWLTHKILKLVQKSDSFMNLWMKFLIMRGRRGSDRMVDLKLPMQSVPITTKVVSSNPVHGKVYSIQHYVIKFVSDFRQVDCFLNK